MLLAVRRRFEHGQLRHVECRRRGGDAAREVGWLDLSESTQYRVVCEVGLSLGTATRYQPGPALLRCRDERDAATANGIAMPSATCTPYCARLGPPQHLGLAVDVPRGIDHVCGHRPTFSGSQLRQTGSGRVRGVRTPFEYAAQQDLRLLPALGTEVRYVEQCIECRGGPVRRVQAAACASDLSAQQGGRLGQDAVVGSLVGGPRGQALDQPAHRVGTEHIAVAGQPDAAVLQQQGFRRDDAERCPQRRMRAVGRFDSWNHGSRHQAAPCPLSGPPDSRCVE
jgi:hypothetical protein